MKKTLCVGSLLFYVFSGFGQVGDTAAVVREVDSLLKIANTLMRSGKLPEALQHAETANLKTEPMLGKDNLHYADCQHQIGAIYNDMGKPQLAEQPLLTGLEIRRRELGPDHLAVSTSLNSLGTLYARSRRWEDAEDMLLEAKRINAKQYGVRHFNYAMGLQNLGGIYRNIGRNEEAEQLFVEVLSVLKDTIGESHPLYAMVSMNLGLSLYERGEYEEAEVVMLKALHDFEKATPRNEQRYLLLIQNLAVLYNSMGRYDAALELCRKGKEISKKAFGEEHYTLGEVATTTGLCYKATGELTKAETEFQFAQQTDLEKLENTANDLEKELTRQVAGFGESMRQVSWQEVQTALQPGEAALEFIHFNYYAPDATDSVLYAALLLKPGMDQPLFIPLFEEKQLKALLPAGGDKLNSDQVNELYGNNALYDLIWAPLKPQLEGVRTVYQSPGGLLHRLNLVALSVGGQTTLADRYDIVTLGSTRQLVLGEKPEASFSATALVYGGIQFDTDGKANPGPETGNGNRGSLGFSAVDSTLRSLPIYEAGWPYLKWSEKEADNIRSVLAKAGYAANVRKGWQASEASFKKIGQGEPSPRILHVSTHGFFFPDPQTVDDRRRTVDGAEPVFKISDHPMIRSGLILAGANQAWKTGKPALPEDGVYVITQDAAGNMWFGGDGDKSIAKKDPNGNWESYDPFELGINGTPSDIWSAAGDVSGNVWFATTLGIILRFDGTNWTLIDTVATTYSVQDTWFADSGPDGTVWFSFVKIPFLAVLARYQAGEWTFFSVPEDIPLPAGVAITSMAFTDNNITWFYAAGNLVKFDGTNWETVATPHNSMSAFASIRKIAGGPDGALWLSSEVGLFRYDGADWTNLSTSNSDIPSDDIYSVKFDHADGMYIGYIPDPAGPNCAVGRNGEWMELLPPGFESIPVSPLEPYHTFVDQDNRFWFTSAHPAGGSPPGVLVYDPLIVGTDEQELAANDLMIFPNPTTGRVTLTLAGNQQEEIQVRVSNLQGQTVYAKTVPAMEGAVIDVNISHLPAGVYYVAVVQGGVVKVGKVVKG